MRFTEFLQEGKDQKKEKEPEAKVAKEKSRIAVLMKTHDDHVKTHNRSAQEAMALSKHHRSHGEHEMAETYKKLAHAYHETAALHKKLHKTYTDRHGEGS